VADSQGVLVGMVTVDDVVDVAQQTATEEMQKMGGVEALDEPYMATPLMSLIKKRVTWLAVLFVGEMFTASAMGYFEHQLERTVVLSLFIPLIVSSGGNSGSQASSLIIRALALREITLADWWRVLKRELVSGVALGGFLGVLGFVRIHIWQLTGMANYTVYYHLVGVTIMCAVMGIVLWGCIVGAMLPFVLKKIKLDPATSSAPFVATLVDVTGIVIYLSVAMLVLRGTLLKTPTFEEVQIPAGLVEAVVRDTVADPEGEPFLEIVVQTDEQTSTGSATRVRVPLAGVPGGVAPVAGSRVRMKMEADHASSFEIVK
jgi:magnesium transporter